jgi:hypothetical protein
MSIEKSQKQPRNRRLKVALFTGATLGILPLLAGSMMLSVSYKNPLSRFLYLVFALGLPGTLFEALLRLEPHGGGTPVEMLFIIMPFNIAFYSVIVYGFGALGKIFHRER